MVGLVDEKNAGIGGNARGLGAKLHGRVERKVEKPVFTHWGKPP
jgi:hypothetical protein